MHDGMRVTTHPSVPRARPSVFR